MYSTANRITDVAAIVREKLSTLPADQVASIDATLNLDPGDYFDYQNLQAHSHAGGLLSTDEALTWYNAVGTSASSSNGGWSSGTDTALKYAVTIMAQKLLEGTLAKSA
jgi:hypothetical protein